MAFILESLMAVKFDGLAKTLKMPIGILSLAYNQADI
jgi:hypothetical protein